MPDYKELYLTLFDATEKAIRELIAAQQKCEELCLRTPLQEPVLLPFPQEPEEKQPKAYKRKSPQESSCGLFGGELGIRTLGRFYPTRNFESCAEKALAEQGGSELVSLSPDFRRRQAVFERSKPEKWL
ncbi:hypothetical protein [Allofournierella massiliensis]|uniref:Uncharacterized protein n=1 Tax=Allofournierella massiliensis TaxID=1650663 RepID=A0ABT7UPX9_9FIRM|nr:hypothetical protein [Fournierella massiliensis]MDM8200946.1 hypothetical protein [Fournierella massiliensis]